MVKSIKETNGASVKDNGKGIPTQVGPFLLRIRHPR